MIQKCLMGVFQKQIWPVQSIHHTSPKVFPKVQIYCVHLTFYHRQFKPNLFTEGLQWFMVIARTQICLSWLNGIKPVHSVFASAFLKVGFSVVTHFLPTPRCPDLNQRMSCSSPSHSLSALRTPTLYYIALIHSLITTYNFFFQFHLLTLLEETWGQLLCACVGLIRPLWLLLSVQNMYFICFWWISWNAWL